MTLEMKMKSEVLKIKIEIYGGRKRSSEAKKEGERK